MLAIPNSSCMFMFKLFCLFNIVACKTCLFLNYNHNALDMFVLKKSIRFCSYMFLYAFCDTQLLLTKHDNSEGRMMNIIPRISNGMLLSKTLLMMYRHCFKSSNTGDIRE